MKPSCLLITLMGFLIFIETKPLFRLKLIVVRLKFSFIIIVEKFTESENYDFI